MWERDVVLRRFGSVDGEILATSAIYDPDEIGSPTGETTELFSLETGRTRCVLDVFAGPTRHGLYADGTAYDLDCRPMWTLPPDADSDQALVDEGVFRWKRIGDDIELLFFGDPAATSKA